MGAKRAFLARFQALEQIAAFMSTEKIFQIKHLHVTMRALRPICARQPSLGAAVEF
jgi:hypothetical protein